MAPKDAKPKQIKKEERRRAKEQERVRDEFAPASKNQVLGHISWVDAENQQAIVYLLNAKVEAEGPLVARNQRGEVSAVLKPPNYKKDRALGTSIVYGTPLKGEEVILRESAELPTDWQKKSESQTPASSKARMFPFVLPTKSSE